MKHNKLFSFLTTAVLGISAASAPVGMTASAETGYCKIDNIRYSYDTETNQATIVGYYGTENTLVIPSSITVPDLNKEMPVTRIGHGAFNSKQISSVTIPASVTYVDQEAFRNCQSLTSLTIL